MGKQLIDQLARFKGALLGLAIGDAVGTTLEFKRPGTFRPIDDMVGGGPFKLRPGQWTDDTSMALCLATSLIEKQEFDPRDQIERYYRWVDEGYMSSTGSCFDIGMTIGTALYAFKQTGKPFSGSTDEYSAGNGSLMRLAPIPMFFANDPEAAIEQSGESSRTTHQHPAAIDACRFFGGLLVGALEGRSKEELLSPLFAPVEHYWYLESLVPEIEEIAEGSYKTKEPPEIIGAGYVVKTLEAVLWAFHRTDNFRDGLLKVVNLGNDADTTGAILGQIAGAHYGLDGIPQEWVEQVHMSEEIFEKAQSLYDCAMK